MDRTDRQDRYALLATVVLLTGLAALVWLGLRTGHLAVAPASVPSAAESTAGSTAATRPSDPPASPPAMPTAAATLPVVPPDPDLAAEFATEVGRLGGQYALAWVDTDGLHVLGVPADDIAWSTIKVPLSIAAIEDSGADAPTEVVPAITESSNDAALALWSGLGPPREAASAVDEVLRAYHSAGTRTESEPVRLPFSAFGQTTWSVPDQARFAAALSCAGPGSAGGEVHALMADVVPDQRWGIGDLEQAHLKGGWGPQDDGGYVVRQLGDVVVAGERYALAGSARALDGTFARATADLTELAQWWAGSVAPGSAGRGCA